MSHSMHSANASAPDSSTNSTEPGVILSNTAHFDPILAFRHWRAMDQERAARQCLAAWASAFTLVSTIVGTGTWLIARQPHIPPEPPPALIAINLAPVALAIPTPPNDQSPGPRQSVSQPEESTLPTPVSAPPSPSPTPPVRVPEERRKRPVPKKKQQHPQEIQKKEIRVTDQKQITETTAPRAAQAPPGPIAAPIPGATESHATHTPLTWQNAVLIRLESCKRYPVEAQTNGEEGIVTLHFTMNRAGAILSARIVASSGHPLLDEETLALVHRASPLPPPPAEIKGEIIPLTVPVAFYLDSTSP
jgi:protein TonB